MASALELYLLARLSGQWLPQAQTDTTKYTVSQATLTQLTNAWPVTANTAVAGTVYRLTAWGSLTTPASSLQAPKWAIQAFGTQLATVAVAASALTASASYEWSLTGIVEIRTAGSSGTADAWLSGSLSQFSSNLSGSNSVPLTGAVGDTSVSTASASTIGLQSEWAATETSQAMTCFGSVFETMAPLF